MLGTLVIYHGILDLFWTWITVKKIMVNPAILFSITNVLRHNFCIFQWTFSICWGQVIYFSDRSSQRFWFFWQDFSKNFFDWLSVFCLKDIRIPYEFWLEKKMASQFCVEFEIFRTSGRILVEKEDSIGIFQGFQEF